MIADAHTHMFPGEMVRERGKFFEGEPAFRLLYDNPKSKLIDAEGLLAGMEKAGVDLSVSFGFPWNNAEYCKQGNDYVMEMAAKYPDKIVAFATLPCCSIDAALAEMDRCASAGVSGIGELSFYCDSSSCSVKDWQNEVASAAKALGLPTLWHVTETVGHDYPGKGGMDPTEAAALVKTVCGTPMIFAHWGGGLPFYELMPEIKNACEQAYYDTAASPYLYDPMIYEVAASVIGANRILFGSDYPLITPSRYIKQLDTTGLSENDKELILGKNLLKLLKREQG